MTHSTISDVSLAMAELFCDQCIGESSGHMAMIPNNPTLDAMAKAHGVMNKEQFAEFLRACADWLDGGGR